MKDEDILKLARERYALEKSLTSDLRAKQKTEKAFKGGDQWPAKIKTQRENDPFGARPCLVINHARTHCNSVVNQMRMNRPQIHVLPVDSDADPETAEMLDGLIRHIQVSGDADLAYDGGADDQVTMGEGYFEIITRIVNEETGEQDLDIEPIKDPHAVHMDPYHENPTGADARWCFIDDPQLRDDLEEEYPDVEITDWADASKDTSLTDWYLDSERVNVARYFYLEKTKATKTEPAKVIWHVCKLIGDKILEKSVFPGKYLPVIRVCGEESFVDGKRDAHGLIRPIMDPCRQYNYWASVNTERIALSPKAPYIGAAEAFEGHEKEWDLANIANIPRLTHNLKLDDGTIIPPPSRSQPIQQDTAIINAMMQAHDDIKAVSGRFDASLGNRSNETSGVAIANRDRQGDVLTFHFTDNLSRAIRQAGRVLVGLIPIVYNTDRVIRILGEDESPDFAEVAATGRALTETRDAAGKIQRIYDLGVGEYDVTVKAGPSFSTRRQESAAEMTEMLARNPQAFQLIGHKLLRNLDWPGADDCADILEAMLPPQVQQILDAKKEGGDQVAMQMEAAQKAIMDQVEPAMAQLQQQAQQAAEAAQQASQENQMLKIQVAGKDLQNQELQMALKDKSSELQIKAMEVEAKATADREAKEADIVIATLSQREESGEKDESQSAMINMVASKAAMAAAKQMTDLAEQMSADMAKQAESHKQLSSGLESVAQSHEQMSAEVVQLKDYVAAEANKKAKVEKAVFGYLKGDQSDAAFERTVKTIEKL